MLIYAQNAHQNTFGRWASPEPAGELKSSPSPPLSAIEGVLLLREGTFQLTGFRTAQPYWNTSPNWNAEFPIVPHSFDGEQTQEILSHLGAQKGANLCLKSVKCTKIRLAAGLRPDPLGGLSALRPLAAIKGLLHLREGRGGEGRGGERGKGRDCGPLNVQSWICQCHPLDAFGVLAGRLWHLERVHPTFFTAGDAPVYAKGMSGHLWTGVARGGHFEHST